MIRRFAPALLLVALCGCFQDKDELTIQPDGSGIVRLEVKSSAAPEMVALTGGRFGNQSVLYPPTSEAEAHKFFPAKDFSVTAKQDASDDGGTVMTITAAFKDINALLASPYGRAHSLTLKIENGQLSCKALTGVELVARLAEMKDETGEMEASMAGLGDLRKKAKEMRMEFRLTLPNAISAANGTREAKTASWVMERAKAKDADEFIQQVGVTMEASCPADGLKMSPVTPIRLGLGTFKDLPTNGVVTTAAGPDVAKITAAAHFTPYVLQATRTLDISREGSPQPDMAKLIGVVSLPHELAPQKWGEAKLEEALDAKGNSLKPDESQGQQNFTRFSSSMEETDDADSPAPEETADVRHTVMLQFRPPDWKMNEVASIKGSVTLQYFGGSQLVKLSNAIPANWIVSQENMAQLNFNQNARMISDPVLPPLGISMQCQMGLVQSGATMLTLQLTGKKADVMDVQVFDVDGRAWPTMLQSMGGMMDGNTLEVIVAGQPKPPLSLALILSSGGTDVEVPILVEHAPLTAK